MMSDEDFFISSQTKSRTTLADALEEISTLKAENSQLKSQIKGLREELKDTQAALGKAVVNANRRQVSSIPMFLPASSF